MCSWPISWSKVQRLLRKIAAGTENEIMFSVLSIFFSFLRNGPKCGHDNKEGKLKLKFETIFVGAMMLHPVSSFIHMKLTTSMDPSGKYIGRRWEIIFKKGGNRTLPVNALITNISESLEFFANRRITWCNIFHFWWVESVSWSLTWMYPAWFVYN